MAWHQDLSNPIPNFNISLHSSVRRPTAERNKAPPMTWGQVKATTLHAQQLLRQQGREEMPENLVRFSPFDKILHSGEFPPLGGARSR
uniref:Uncharacterized protein n=1 Tax=Salvator merianae TaxID=96440 RepID=A0A8D0C578_SALMN